MGRSRTICSFEKVVFGISKMRDGSKANITISMDWLPAINCAVTLKNGSNR